MARAEVTSYKEINHQEATIIKGFKILIDLKLKYFILHHKLEYNWLSQIIQKF